MLRSYMMEFYEGVDHVGTSFLSAQSATDAVNEARFMLKHAWDMNHGLTHARILDVRNDGEVEVVATVNL